ncbi:MAG TPA: T9SS type A sorting domain-containing protein, partial [Saprospiraceae bacterium]|nr:T9SS type A sorting domain-containing protein [Saprospiraceae bacterium]
GDVDLIGTTSIIPNDSLNYIYVHLNTPGSNGKPLFNTVLQSPYGLPTSFGQAQFLFPNLVDIDGDGDDDFFVFRGGADNLVLEYYENTACTPSSNEMVVDICEGDAFKLGGNTYTDEGVYTVHLVTSEGCDSTILLTIEFAPVITMTINESICDGDIFEIGNETFTETGDYTILLVAANGCDSIIQLSLEVLQVSSTTIEESLCEGESFNLGGVEYTEPGVYSAVFVNHAGCDSTVVAILEFIDVDNSVTVQDNIITANASSATYQWIDCTSGEAIVGATAQTFSAQVTGNYAVRVTDISGCIVISDCISIIISSTERDILTNSISVYPNPANDAIYLLNNSGQEITSVTITNLAGQVMDQITFNNNQSADISFLVKGIYVMRIKINGVTVIKSLVVI